MKELIKALEIENRKLINERIEAEQEIKSLKKNLKAHPKQEKPKQIIHTMTLNGYVWSQDETGEWTHKAQEGVALVKKKEVPKQAKYGDVPSFKLVDKIEDQYIKSFMDSVKFGINSFIKELAIHHT